MIENPTISKIIDEMINELHRHTHGKILDDHSVALLGNVMTDALLAHGKKVREDTLDEAIAVIIKEDEMNGGWLEIAKEVAKLKTLTSKK